MLSCRGWFHRRFVWWLSERERERERESVRCRIVLISRSDFLERERGKGVYIGAAGAPDLAQLGRPSSSDRKRKL